MKIVKTIRLGVDVLAIEGRITHGEETLILRNTVLETLIDCARWRRLDKAKVVFDLRGCNFIDAAGLREFVNLFNRLTSDGGRMVFANLAPCIQELFELTKLSTVFFVYRTVDEAVASFLEEPRAERENEHGH